MSIEGKTAVVTGGASGIGRAICVRLGGLGVNVAILDLDQTGAEETAHQVVAAGQRALPIKADVSSAADVTDAIEQVRANLGPVHILINDAGICEIVPFVEMTEAQWERMITVHLRGTFNCTRAVLPDMIQAKWGRIVNLASVAGLSGAPGFTHYAAAKGGINAFTKALAHEVGPSGITVNAIAPGLVDTPMTRNGLLSDEMIEMAVTGAPVQRMGTPDDIAAACAYFVSADAGFTTGQVLSPNGGRYM